MPKHISFRVVSSRDLFAGFRSTVVVVLCAMLLIQPTFGWGQEPQPVPQTNTSRTEISSAQPAEELPSAPVPQSSTEPQQQTKSGQQPDASQSQQPPAQQQPPVGTAAAPYERPTGVPGSRPAGAAIAPAKQRRVRAIVISLGLVLAGAGAIGAIAGLSKASHSQP